MEFPKKFGEKSGSGRAGCPAALRERGLFKGYALIALSPREDVDAYRDVRVDYIVWSSYTGNCGDVRSTDALHAVNCDVVPVVAEHTIATEVVAILIYVSRIDFINATFFRSSIPFFLRINTIPRSEVITEVLNQYRVVSLAVFIN